MNFHYQKNSMYNAWSIDYKKDDCVNSKQVADTILSLPVHAYLEQKEIATIVKVAIDLSKIDLAKSIHLEK